MEEKAGLERLESEKPEPTRGETFHDSTCHGEVREGEATKQAPGCDQEVAGAGHENEGLGDGGHKAQENRHRLLSLGQGWTGLLPGGLCSVGRGRVWNFRGDLLPGNGKSMAVLWSVASERLGGEAVGPGVPGLEGHQRG